MGVEHMTPWLALAGFYLSQIRVELVEESGKNTIFLPG